jgi:hypothetical protein
MIYHHLLRSDPNASSSFVSLFPQTSTLYAHLMGLGKLDELALLIFRVSEKSLGTRNSSNPLLIIPLLSYDVFRDYRSRSIF